MKGYVYLFLLLALPVFASGALKEGWYNDGETFTLDGIQHEVLHEFEDNKALIIIGSQSLMVKEGKCDSKGGREYCILQVARGLDHDQISYSGGGIVGAVEIRVNELSPDVALKRTIGETTLELSERYTVAIEISNSGNRGVDWFEYWEEMPPELVIGESASTENVFRAEGSLAPDQTRTFTYTIYVEAPFSPYVSEGNLTYEYEGETTSLLGNSITLTVDAPFSIDVDVDKDAIAFGEHLDYEVVIENEDEEESIRIRNLEIYAPEFKVLDYDDNLTDEKGGKFTWSGWMEPEQILSFKMSLEGSMAGEQEIRLHVNLEEKSEVYSFDEITEVDVELEGLTAFLKLTPAASMPGQSIKMVGTLENNDAVQMTLTKATLKAFGETFTSDKTFVEGNADVKVFSERINAPDEPGEYDILFEGRYENPSGQYYDFSKKVVLEVVQGIVEGAEDVEDVVEELDDEVEDSSDVEDAPRGITAPKEKKGFFSKVFGGIGGFFSWLFS